jgi:mono/diheme cytochrome c family protein
MNRPSLSIALVASAVATGALAQQPQWPPGEGREIVSVACVQCHQPTIIMTLREGPAGWRFHVHDMILRGAQIKNSEVETVVNYLASNFAPGVNLPAAAPVTLPEGAGKQLVEQRCVACHDLQRVGTERLGRKDWDRVVGHMLDIGAPMTPDEAKTITAYLREKLPGKP